MDESLIDYIEIDIELLLQEYNSVLIIRMVSSVLA